MRLRDLILALLCAVLAATIARALVTHAGVGAGEWVAGVALVAVLVAGAAGRIARS
jgi:hypothetical protein